MVFTAIRIIFVTIPQGLYMYFGNFTSSHFTFHLHFTQLLGFLFKMPM
jgi:hypothetical protein